MLLQIVVASVLVIMVVAAVMLVLQMRQNITIDLPKIWAAFDQISQSHQQLQQSVSADLSKLRDENTAAAKQSQNHIDRAVQDLKTGFDEGLTATQKTVTAAVQASQTETGKGLADAEAAIQTSAQAVREELVKSSQGVREGLGGELAKLGETQQTVQQQLLGTITERVDQASQKSARQSGEMRDQLTTQLEQLQAAVSALADKVNAVAEQQGSAQAGLDQLQQEVVQVRGRLNELGTTVSAGS